MLYLNSMATSPIINSIRIFILRLIIKSTTNIQQLNERRAIPPKVSRFRLIASGGMLIALASSSAQAITVGVGFTPDIAQWSSTLNPPEGKSLPMNVGEMYNRGYNFKIGVLPNTASVSILCNVPDSSDGVWSSIDGYYGWTLASGVLLVPKGSVSGHTEFQDNTTNPLWQGDFSGSWSEKGMPSGSTMSSTTPNCSGPRVPELSDTARAWMSAGNRSTLTLSLGLYVSKDAAAASIPVRYMYHLKSAYNDMPAGNGELPGRAIARFALPAIEVIPTSCSIATPAEVQFGDVSSGESAREKGIAVPSSLNFSCSKKTSESQSISYSVRPKTEAGSQYMFPMISTAGGTAGDIRGFWGATAAADAGCTDKSSSVRMDNTPSVLRTITQSDSWTENFVWVLCPRPDAKPGPASATATIEVIW